MITLRTLKISLNGEPFEIVGPLTVNQLLTEIDLDPRGVAVEHNLKIVKRDSYDSLIITEGDQIEVVHFVGGGMADDQLTLGGTTFHSRLIVGTGK